MIEVFGGGADVLREPELATGYPDIVAVFARRGFDWDARARSKVSQRDLKVLHHLWMEGGACVSRVSQMLGLSERAVWEHADRLLRAELLRVRSTHLSARAIDFIFAATRIIAIEAKVGDWRHAIDQAMTNQWFASHSYVLLPRRQFLDAAASQASRSGIGVLVFDGSCVEVVVRAERQRLPASVGSWIVNEWLVNAKGEGSDARRG